MKIASPYERLQQLIGLIDLHPTKTQVVQFLSLHLCPQGETSGISWSSLGEDGYFIYESVRGLTKNLDPSERVSITDDNVIPLALRTSKTQVFDMEQMYLKFKSATHRDGLSHYSSGFAMPIGDSQVLGAVFSGSIESLSEYLEYFECVRLVLSLWQSKTIFHSKSISKNVQIVSNSLTKRQEHILEMIKEGRTNGSIASILGYSESLVRQETIIIYRKLGIAGRNELRKRTESEL
jgi:DNA-binding CsgD family transcriptional regulator